MLPESNLASSEMRPHTRHKGEDTKGNPKEMPKQLGWMRMRYEFMVASLSLVLVQLHFGLSARIVL